MTTPLEPAEVRSRVAAALSAAHAAERTIVLAVSGGIDSMVLLSAAGAIIPPARLVAATFDHGTGAAAASAAALVRATAARLGLRCVAARATGKLGSEAALRDARWTFLREVARAEGGIVATAHTRDDQVETILMRVLRHAGARGLAALYAEGPVLRPFIDVSRADVARYAAAERIEWVEDPSNATRAYLRNRVRHDHLPALRAARPTIERELIDVARRAASLRCEVDATLAELEGVRLTADGTGIDVAADLIPSADAARLFWAPLLAKAGLVLNRRGLERLAAFAEASRVGARIQVAGGWQVVRSRTHFEVRSLRAVTPTAVPLGLSAVTVFGAWSFTPVAGQEHGSPWIATLPVAGAVVVRGWRAGDTMRVRADGRAKKVKRLLSEAGVTGHNRAGWPVVLAGDEIVWIPGVCRAPAAAAPPGAPVERGLPFLCEHIHG